MKKSKKNALLFESIWLLSVAAIERGLY